jgi:malate permease and related proteins
MNQVLNLLFFLALGILAQRAKFLPHKAAIYLGKFILWVPLPALVLTKIPDFQFSSHTLPLIFSTWIVLFGAMILFLIISSLYSWPREILGCLILTAGFSNTSFLGLPLLKAFYGENVLGDALILDQLGSFFLVSTLGTSISILFSGQSISLGFLFKKVIFFPPFISFILAMMMNYFQYSLNASLIFGFEMISQLLTPLALICVGLQLKLSSLFSEKKYIVWGLGYKLFLAPLFVLLIFKDSILNSQRFNVMVMESAMAPMITSSLLAVANNLRPKLASLMVGLGVIISFFTLIFWYFSLKWLGYN